MRLPVALLAVAGLAGLCVAIVAAGEALRLDSPAIEFDELPANAPLAPDPQQSDVSAEEPQAASARDENSLERIAPRPPLSDLSTPQPPKPPKAIPPERWQPTRLFNPVATSAGVVEAQGHRVALVGIEPLSASETCRNAGPEWPCGVQARTAFRSWLRARALLCKVPPEPDREIIAAECRVGNEDPAQWLVASGWARAVAGGPYVEVGKQAETAGRGMFGAPPRRPEPVAPPANPAEATPPASLPAPSQ